MNKLFIVSCSRGYYNKIQWLLLKLTLWPLTVDREMVKVDKNQARVLLVLPILLNVLRYSVKPM